MKPKIAFFDFAGCEGCQLQIVNLEEEMFDLVGAVEIVSFREVMDRDAEDYDIAFIEGSVTRRSDVERLMEIRDRAKIVVALGACACTGGVNCLKNLRDLERVRSEVYGKDGSLFETSTTLPVDAVVKVDYYVPGCPIDRAEFLSVVKALLMGVKPELPTYPVCVECKLNEFACVFEHGGYCLGPVIRAGCGALCPGNGAGCLGCRGLVDEPAEKAEIEVLRKHGLTVEEAIGKFRLFSGYQEKLKCQP